MMKEIENKINIEQHKDKTRDFLTQLVQKYEETETEMLAKIIDELLMVKLNEELDTQKTVKEYKKVIDVNKVVAKYESNLTRKIIDRSKG
mmetsp:Transcript_27719/g.31890  ORF Transcript_27719/g.31890 Transcript_27719/m.31890 type:complete len:90 (+) Transcript_27719:181-450(+)